MNLRKANLFLTSPAGQFQLHEMISLCAISVQSTSRQTICLHAIDNSLYAIVILVRTMTHFTLRWPIQFTRNHFTLRDRQFKFKFIERCITFRNRPFLFQTFLPYATPFRFHALSIHIAQLKYFNLFWTISVFVRLIRLR